MKSWGWYWNPVNQFQLFAVIKPAISLYAFMSVQQQMLCNKHAHTHSHTEERHKKKRKKKSFFHTGMQSECLLIIRDNMVNQTERWNVVILSLKDSATCVLSHIPTHTSMWLFRLKLMGVGGVGGGSCAVATTDLCNDMKINTCGENSSGWTGALLHRCSYETQHSGTNDAVFSIWIMFCSLFSPHAWRLKMRDGWWGGESRKAKKKKKIPDRDLRKHWNISLMAYCLIIKSLQV